MLQVVRTAATLSFVRMASGGIVGALQKSGIKKEAKDVTEEEWKKILGPEEYHVTREAGTERPFTGKYDKFVKNGMYHCLCCGAPLFSSDTKFNSGCGWPAFHTALGADSPDGEGVKRIIDESIEGRPRVEVRCKTCNAHLGHVFDDGPKPTGERFCINSCAVDFEPKK